MKDLLEYIVKNLVTNPDAVIIEEHQENGNVDLSLTVDSADMGFIIGKGGQTIHAIRKLLTVRAIGENVRVNLRLEEPAGGAERPEEPSSSDKSDEIGSNQNETEKREETSDEVAGDEEKQTTD